MFFGIYQGGTSAERSWHEIVFFSRHEFSHETAPKFAPKFFSLFWGGPQNFRQISREIAPQKSKDYHRRASAGAPENNLFLALRAKEKHINIGQVSGIVPGLGGGKNVFMCSFPIIP